MAIPTIIARESLDAGPDGAQGSPAAFGAAAARALGKLGQGVQGAGQAASEAIKIGEKRKRDAAVREGGFDLYKGQVEWMEENKNSLTLAEDFEDNFTKQLDEQLLKQTDKAGRQRLLAQADAVKRQFQARATVRGAQNVVRETELQRFAGARQEGNMFRETYDVAPVASNERLLDRYGEELALAGEDLEGEMRVETLNELTKEFFFSAVAKDTDTAQAILDENTTLPSQVREGLQRKIDAGNTNLDQDAKAGLLEEFSNKMKLVQAGKTDVLFEEGSPKEAWQAAFGAKEGARRWEQNQVIIKREQAIVGTTEVWRGMSPQAVAADLETLRDSTEDGEFLTRMIDVQKALAQQAEDDIGGYMLNNPLLQATADETGWDGKGAMPSEVADKMLELQGTPPPGTDPRTAAHYHFLPQQQRNIDSNARLKRHADFLNSTSLDETEKALEYLAEQWPDPEHRDQALIDMAADLAAPMKLVMAGYDGTNLPIYTKDFLSAQKGLKENENLVGDKKDAIDAAFETHPKIVAFVASFEGDFGEDTTLAFEMRDSIRAYAVKLARNLDPDEAVSKAVEDVLRPFALLQLTRGDLMVSSSKRVAGVAGETPTEVPWSEGELGNIRANANSVMTLLSDNLKFDELELLNHVALDDLKQTAGSSPAARDFAQESLTNSIKRRGIWAPTKDGGGLVLNLVDDRGEPVPLLKMDEDGMPQEIVVSLDTLALPGKPGVVGQLLGGKFTELSGEFSATETPVDHRKGALHKDTINVNKLRSDAQLVDQGKASDRFKFGAPF